MSRPIPPIILNEEQQRCLHSIAQSREISHSLVQRSQIILEASQGQSNKAIGQLLNLTKETVGMWRNRWLENIAELDKCAGKPKQLKVALEQVLSDKARPGSPGEYSAEQQCQIIALACETPPEHLSHWTREALATEAIKRGIVESISVSTIGRFLKSGGLKTASQSILVEP